jgi:hypothetical protein
LLEGNAPAAGTVAAFLARALEAIGTGAPTPAGELVSWNSVGLLSNHSIKACSELADFRRMPTSCAFDSSSGS